MTERKDKTYQPDAFDTLGEDTRPAGVIEKDFERWAWWQNRPIPGLENPLDRLDADLALYAMNWQATVGKRDNVVGRVLMPMTNPSESDWNRSNVELQERQTAISLPPKPTENALSSRSNNATHKVEKREVPKFHESHPNSTEKLSLGD